MAYSGYLGHYTGISNTSSLLTPTLNAIPMGDGTNWVTKVDDLARQGLGLGSINNVVFNQIDFTTMLTKGGARYSHAQGVDSVHVGLNAANILSTSLSASRNTTLGVRAFQAVQTAINNVHVGTESGTANIAGNNNSGVGDSALKNNTSSGNCALGSSAGSTQSGSTDCIFIGRNADASVNNLTNSIAFGAGVTLSASNTMLIGTAAAPINVSLGGAGTTNRLNVSGSMMVSGTYNVGATQVVSTRKTGWTAATGTATRTTWDTSTATTTQLAQALKALLDDLISHGLIGT